MRLLIVIVNYRTPALTIDTLRSVEPELHAIGSAGGAIRVVVVDGKSPDDSVARISEAIATNGWSGLV